MWTDYKDADIHFTIADTRFHTLNFVYERFERSIPSHSHGNGSYEIHYIPQGRGRALIDGVYHEVIPAPSMSPGHMWSTRRVRFWRIPCANTAFI